MENMTNETRKPKSLIFLIVSILGTIVFSIFGVYLVAFVILPSLISRDSIKSAIETKLNAAGSNSAPKNAIAGLPTAEINPFLQRLKDGAMTYQWKTGDVHAYDFSFRLGDEQNKPFKIQGNVQYTIGSEKPGEINRTGEGVGTAFVIAPGYLATSARVVRIAERVTFILANKRYAAKIVDVDPVNDLAILAYEGEESPVGLGSSAKVKLADEVFVLGFPVPVDQPQGIKVTAGKISKIDEAQGSLAFSIESELLDPGHSGGPVVNSQGEITGIANIPSQGERTVGFASRVDGLRELMTKNNISIQPSTSDTILTSEEIAERISPHVGQLELSNWVDNRNVEIDFYATYDGTVKSPVVIFNGVRQEGLSGKMLVSRLGELRSISNVDPLPFVLASIPELLLQPFDLAAHDKWLVYRNYQIDPPQRSAPGLMRPKMRDMFRGPAERQPGIPAVLESDYEVVSSDQDVMRIKKTRRFRMPTDRPQPSLEVHGEGVWEFDTKQGLPISLEENLTVSNHANGKTTEIPLFYKVTRNDPTVVQERVRLAQEQAEKKKKEQEIEQTQPNPALVDELVLQISSKDAEQRFSALNRLARIAIVEDKRESTLKALRAVIAGKDSILHSLGWPAYTHWMNPACAPELRRIVGKSSTHRKAALNALFELKLEEDLPLMIANLSSLTYDAQKSLSKFGPKVEPAVLERLLREKDSSAQIELIRLLQEVGTQQSIDKLTELSSAGDFGMKIRAESAIAIIKRRLEQNPE